MNREEFNTAMTALGSRLLDPAKALIRIVADRNDLAERHFNFVPVGDGLYEILESGGRERFFPVNDRPGGKKFVGTLEEAYQWVYEDQVWVYEESERFRAEVQARKEGLIASSDGGAAGEQG